LIENAKPNFNFYLISFFSSGGGVVGAVGAVAMGALMGSFKKMLRGLWVGGTTYLTEEKIIFAPNELNKMLQSNIDRLEIPLSDIVSVSKESGFITNIIRIDTKNGTLKLRCFGSSEFMEKIIKQVAV
jgi:hypothetical protein